MDHLNKLVRMDLVDGLPYLHFENNKLCDVCQKRNQVEAPFKSKNIVYTDQPLQLLHMNLFVPYRIESLDENVYDGNICYLSIPRHYSYL